MMGKIRCCDACGAQERLGQAQGPAGIPVGWAHVGVWAGTETTEADANPFVFECNELHFDVCSVECLRFLVTTTGFEGVADRPPSVTAA